MQPIAKCTSSYYFTCSVPNQESTVKIQLLDTCQYQTRFVTTYQVSIRIKDREQKFQGHRIYKE